MDMPAFARSALATLFLGAFTTGLLVACTVDPPATDPCGYVQSTATLEFPPDQGGPAVTLFGQCLGRAPDIHDDGTPECIVIDARASATCDCTTPGLEPVSDDHAGAVDAAKELVDPAASCFCEVVPLTGDAAKACQNDENNPPSLNGEAVQGYCYLDGDLEIGDPKLLAPCVDSERHLLRLAGEVQKAAGQTLVFFCAAKVCDDGAAE